MSGGGGGPQRFRVAAEGIVVEGYESFFDVVAGLDHLTEMGGGDAVDPGIGHELIGFMAGQQEIFVGQRDNFLFVEAAGSNFKLHVDGVGMADGDRILRPTELYGPGSAEGIGPGFKRAVVFGHSSAIVAALSPGVQGGGEAGN